MLILPLLVVIWVQNTVAVMVDVTTVAAEGVDDLALDHAAVDPALDHVIDIHADRLLHTAADLHPLIPPAAPDPDECFLNCHFRSKTLSPHMQIPLFKPSGRALLPCRLRVGLVSTLINSAPKFKKSCEGQKYRLFVPLSLKFTFLAEFI